VKKQTITLFIILSLLSSVLSVASTSSEQINQSFGEKSKGDKPKETKSDSKPKKEDKSDDKAKLKEEEKPKDTKSKEDKPNDEIITRDDDNNKKGDTSSTSNDDPLSSPSLDTSPAPTSSTNQGNPLATLDPTTTPLTTLNPIPLSTTTTPPPTTQANADNQSSSKSIIASPIDENSTQNTPLLTSSDKIQNGTQPCEPSNKTCQPSEKPLLKYCPNGYHKDGGVGVCKLYLKCDSSKYNNCPPTTCILNQDCPSGFTCSNGYNIKGINGDCRLKISCDSSKGKCPPDRCNVFAGDCKPVRACITNSTNSTDTSYYPPKNKNVNKPKDTSSTDTVIKYYITNPIIQQQVAQQPANVLIPMDTLQFCNLIGDQACVFMNSSFKILFNQTTQDNLGNWMLNGEAQNIGANPLNNVIVVWHLYDALGNIVGVTQGSPIPSNLGIGQTTIFNLQLKPTDLTGIPKFYRISFVF
jgi:hypothetical protein